MINSLRNRILSDIVWMIVMILMISASGIISIQILKSSSYKIAEEYYEMKSIHELTPLLQELVYPANNFLVYHQHADLVMFRYKSIEFSTLLEEDKKEIPDIHIPVIERLSKNNHEIDELISNYFNTLQNNQNLPTQASLSKLNDLFNNMNDDINLLLDETREEIEYAIAINKKAIKHSTLLIIILTFLVSIGGIIWSYSFLKKITLPINQLINFTRRVSKGDFSTRLQTHYDEELNNLAVSLNKMTEDLSNSTVKRDYFDNIINSISDAIFVTTIKGEIQMVNHVVEEKLGYKSKELLKNTIFELIELENKQLSSDGTNDLPYLLKCCSDPSNRVFLKAKTNNNIPVLIAHSVLKSGKTIIGTVVVAHDITENLKIERQIARERRTRQLLINEAQENERLRIATELHDGLGHMLTALQYFIENKIKNTAPGKEEFASALEELQSQLDQIVIETKNISHDLIPMLLKDFGIDVALKKIINETNAKNPGIKINFDSFNINGRLEPGIEKAIFRLAQEGINNIVKHSKAENAFIQLIKHEKSIVLLIDDDGVGFDLKKKTSETGVKGIGLMSMRERVETLNGTISIETQENKGTEILIEIPLE